MNKKLVILDLNKDIDFFGANREQDAKWKFIRFFARFNQLYTLGSGKWNHEDTFQKRREKKFELIQEWIDNKLKNDPNMLTKWVEQKFTHSTRKQEVLAQYEKILINRGIDKDSASVQNFLECSEILLNEFKNENEEEE